MNQPFFGLDRRATNTRFTRTWRRVPFRLRVVRFLRAMRWLLPQTIREAWLDAGWEPKP